MQRIQLDSVYSMMLSTEKNVAKAVYSLECRESSGILCILNDAEHSVMTLRQPKGVEIYNISSNFLICQWQTECDNAIYVSVNNVISFLIERHAPCPGCD